MSNFPPLAKKPSLVSAEWLRMTVQENGETCYTLKTILRRPVEEEI